MIPNGEKQHYLAVKKLPVLSRGKMSKHYGDFYYMNCLQKTYFSHIKEYVNKDFENERV